METVLKNNPENDTAYGEVYSHSEGRSCFGLIWYPTEEAAKRAAAQVDSTYNGGWFHGMPCGRDGNFDYTDPDDGQAYFAVSH